MANCLNCGTPLPSFSFGDASPLCPNCRRAEQQAAQLQAPPRTKPWDELPQAATFGPAWFSATYFLIAVNVIIFAIMVAKGVSFRLPSSYDILTWGGEFAPATLSGEYWRLITAAFLHIGIFHLAVNMWALYVVVPPIERLFGRTMTFAVYLLTGVGASLLSLSWNTTTVSAGASGAVFGFIGLIISFFHFARLNVRPELVSTIRSWAMRMAVINLLFGFSVSGINNMAHLGGLVTGLIMGTFLAFTFHHPVEERFAGQVRVALISAVALAGIFGFILRAKADVRELGLGDAALRRNDTSAAIAHFQKSVALKPNSAAAHVALASALYQAQQLDSSQRESERALAIDPETHLAELILGYVYVKKGQPQNAVPLFRKCEPKLQFDAEDYSYYGSALLQTGDLQQAERMLQKAIANNSKYAWAHQLLSEVYERQDRKTEADREKKLAQELEPKKK